MAQDTYNVIPVTLAVLLHVIVFGSLFVAFDLSPSAAPPMPLAIKATLVVEDESQPPVVQEPVQLPEPEPEPEAVQPDPDEEDRNKAEEDKRVEDARVERDREEAERIAAEDKARREREAEAERVRILKELEDERLRIIEQQRLENIAEMERIESQNRADIIAAEEVQFAAQNSTEAQVYQNMITQRVFRNWARPGTARDDLKCIVSVQQIPGGTVVSVRVIESECNGDERVRRSVIAAVQRASPLPQPSNPLLFLRTFQITFLKTSTIDD